MFVPSEPIEQIALHGFNLLSNWESRDSLEELIKNDYTLEMYRTYEIKRFCRYYLNGSCDFMARRIIKKIEALEMKEQEESTGTTSATSSSFKPVVATSSANKPSTSALPTVTVENPSVVVKNPISKDISIPPTSSVNMPNVPVSSKSSKPLTSTSSAVPSKRPVPLPEIVISSKRTLPTKFVPKKKEAVSVAYQKPCVPEVRRPSIDQKLNAEKQLQKFIEKKKIIEEKKKEGAIQVSNVMNAFEEARLKRKQEALKARQLGFWEEPKAKKGRYSKY
ncbi:hypothetical protein GCK72_010969 [Caenorhabditis remanei]|uniref:Uncharacterized protein n=1 Tax=Caenorhabditis remanei TaxID=31234 RepID=A0A6A5H692_CAERE|nr:hypothetical protein GCK72_010969 [Caenorhabditis remanei]KAF1762707.1 hypothetical protein GCK72_010969 [Caenorhabditis remanei]